MEGLHEALQSSGALFASLFASLKAIVCQTELQADACVRSVCLTTTEPLLQAALCGGRHPACMAQREGERRSTLCAPDLPGHCPAFQGPLHPQQPVLDILQGMWGC